MPPELSRFIELDALTALKVVLLGFIGGTLSGFIGSGGAFFMTPGMMNLGVNGVVAVASNITHKFGKAMMGSKRHGEMGNVDKKLGIFLLLTAFIGIRLAVWINTTLLGVEKGAVGTEGAALSNLYISVVFVTILSLVGLSMLRDVRRTMKEEMGPSRRLTEFLSRLRLFPMIRFPVADVSVSLWIILAVGLATGYLAGTIGVGGFIGVPAMIYVFGIPTAVAAGTELYLAMFMGAFGAVNYVYEGVVDIRLTLLLYLGSLVAINIGAYGTKVVKELVIRLVTSVVILICVCSRGVAIPMYLGQLGWVDLNEEWYPYLDGASEALLYFSGITGLAVILYNVYKAHRLRSRMRARLEAARTPAAVGESPAT